MILWLLLACSGGEINTVPEPVQDKARAALPDLPTPSSAGVPHRTSVPISNSSGTTFAINTLSTVVDDHARDPSNPWAIGHGLVAKGSPLTLTNGEDAVQWLFREYAERFQHGDQWLLRFPTKRGKIRIEPHTDLLLKALTDAGIDPDTVVQVQGKTHTVADLYRGSLAETWFKADTGETSFSTTNDIPWSLFGIASWSTKQMEWTSSNGHRSSLDAWTDHAMEILIKETLFLAEAKAANREFEKRGQGIFRYTCGGSHFLQGVAHATLRGFGSESNRARLKEQLHLLMYRFPIELKQIDAGEKRHPDFKLHLRVQRLKLTGHTLETLYRISATEMIGKQDRQALEIVTAELVKSVVLLQKIDAFQQLPTIRKSNEQLYLDLVGDSAHALRGLLTATGSRPVYY